MKSWFLGTRSLCAKGVKAVGVMEAKITGDDEEEEEDAAVAVEPPPRE